MLGEDLRRLESVYQSALEARGEQRLLLFGKFSDDASQIAREYIYTVPERQTGRLALGFANLMHNLLGSLCALQLAKDLGADRVRSGICSHADSVLVQNGASTLELLRELETNPVERTHCGASELGRPCGARGYP